MNQTTFAQTTIVLQPDGSLGKDAGTSSVFANSNYGGNIDFAASAWTYQGTPVDGKSLIEFDLSEIPEGAVINSALLSLYSFNSPFNGTHSTLSGSNETVLSRITDPWEENTVTWNNTPSTTDENQVFLQASTSPIQDYLDLDVTNMVQDMTDNPSNSHGFLMELLNTQHYRRMVFGSSDNEDPDLHPKLEISFSVFDCPELLLNIGEPCDDGNNFTENDAVNENCECEGNAVLVLLNGNIEWNSNCGPETMFMQFHQPGTDNLMSSQDVDVNSEGDYQFVVVQGGEYDIYVKADGFLQKGAYAVQLFEVNNSVNFEDLISGDINNDNVVNILDVSLMNASFGFIDGGAGYNPAADLNCDGGVNILDISLINSSFGQSGDAP